uniref:BAH domain-containing protein n=1 Tax=Timema shepardi TaxID=629360 RepID=A0A7R9AQ15_TIMSH|nr:unnamed protein product [Timema shepardi]
MAYLVLTDSSQLTADGFEKLPNQIISSLLAKLPALPCFARETLAALLSRCQPCPGWNNQEVYHDNQPCPGWNDQEVHHNQRNLLGEINRSVALSVAGYYQPAGPLISSHHHHHHTSTSVANKVPPAVLSTLEASATPTPPPSAAPHSAPPSQIISSTSTPSGTTRGGDESSDNDVVITATSCSSGGGEVISGPPHYPPRYPPPTPHAQPYPYSYQYYPSPPSSASVQYPGVPIPHYHSQELCYPPPPYYHPHKPPAYSSPPPPAPYHRRYPQYYPAELYPGANPAPPPGPAPQQSGGGQQQVVASGATYQHDAYPPPVPPPAVVDPYPPPPPPPPGYYAGYGATPACYTHSPPSRSLFIDATYQSCPCPMQSCPKNVLTGPLTGDGKGPHLPSKQQQLPLPPVALALPLEPPGALGPPSPARGSAGMPLPPSPATGSARNPSSWSPEVQRTGPSLVEAAQLPFDKGDTDTLLGVEDSTQHRLLTIGTLIEKPVVCEPKLKSRRSSVDSPVANQTQNLPLLMCDSKFQDRGLQVSSEDVTEPSVKQELRTVKEEVFVSQMADKGVFNVDSCTTLKRKVESLVSDAPIIDTLPATKRQKVLKVSELALRERTVFKSEGLDMAELEAKILPELNPPRKSQPLSLNNASVPNSKFKPKKRKSEDSKDSTENAEPESSPTKKRKRITALKVPKFKELRAKTYRSCVKQAKSKNFTNSNPKNCVNNIEEGVCNIISNRVGSRTIGTSMTKKINSSCVLTGIKKLSTTKSTPKKAETKTTVSTATQKRSALKQATSKGCDMSVTDGNISRSRVDAHRKRALSLESTCKRSVGSSCRSASVKAAPIARSNSKLCDSIPDPTQSDEPSSPCLPEPMVGKQVKKESFKKPPKVNGLISCESVEVLDGPACKKTPLKKALIAPKWSNGWSWEGEPFTAKVFLTSEVAPVVRRCYPSMRHIEGDIIYPHDCVLLKSGTRKIDLPFVAKVAALWENPDDGEMMVSLLWYYRPEHTEQGRMIESMEDELFASKHKDINSVACIEDKCYVLTFNEYCRYRKCLRRFEDSIRTPGLVVPLLEGYPRKNRQPPGCVAPELVFFCRKVYEYRQRRILKNPG